MKDTECVEFLYWALPRLHLRWQGFRKVRRQVCKRIGRRIRELNLSDGADYRIYLENHAAEWSVLDDLCRVTISRFYRDREVFAALEGEVLPVLAEQVLSQGEGTLMVWSAGCASGEEPYTLTLLWRFALQDRYPGLQLAILATDTELTLLTRARQACYPASSLKRLPPTWRESAFEKSGDAWCLRPEYRMGITFLEHDIRDLPPDGPFYLVLCRNLVLTYFDAELQREVLNRIRDALHPGGILITGARETLPDDDLGFASWRGGIPVFRKV